MLTVVTALAVVAFTATTVLYVSEFFGSVRQDTTAGRRSLWAAVACTVGVIVAAVVSGGIDALIAPPTILVYVTLLVSLGFVVAHTRNPSLEVLGAFVAPGAALALTAFLVLQFVESGTEDRINAVLISHVAFASIGLAAFTIASFLAAVYLVQERQLRHRSFGRLFQRLPDLDVLDDAGLQFVLVGFAVFTVSLLLGAFWAMRTEHAGQPLRIYLSATAWLIFAVVLRVRIRSGWRGRKSAMLTIAGTAASLAVLAVYVFARLRL